MSDGRILDGLDSLFSTLERDDQIFKILTILLDPEENLEVKSEIKKPFLFAAIKTYDDYLKSHNLTKSAGILSKFVKDSLRLFISHDRKSREEIIRAIASSNMNSEVGLEPGLKEKKRGLISK